MGAKGTEEISVVFRNNTCFPGIITERTFRSRGRRETDLSGIGVRCGHPLAKLTIDRKDVLVGRKITHATAAHAQQKAT